VGPERATGTAKNNPMRIKFGKHKGKAVWDIPSDYLCWLERQDWVDPDLAWIIREELRSRGIGRDPEPEPAPKGITLFIDDDDVVSALELVKHGRKSAALQHHPDRGGNLRRMQQVNAVADRLTKQLQLFEVRG
jgi:uncharacterized protein (DUF3820 family)